MATSPDDARARLAALSLVQLARRVTTLEQKARNTRRDLKLIGEELRLARRFLKAAAGGAQTKLHQTIPLRAFGEVL